MVSTAAYRIIKKAVKLRINQGEEVNAVIAEYTKLSDKQKAQLLTELAAEGYIAGEGEAAPEE